MIAQKTPARVFFWNKLKELANFVLYREKSMFLIV
jgi:hypothetical protein